jgi:hypothetical protein
MTSTVTFDSTTKPTETLVLKARSLGWHVAFVSVSKREWPRTGFDVSLEGYEILSEIVVWDESPWDEAEWADDAGSECLEEILKVISNGGFPKDRGLLTEGQLHQLRDAMILQAHFSAERSVFVTADVKGFIRHGRREQLETLLQTRILSPFEFKAELELSEKPKS